MAKFSVGEIAILAVGDGEACFVGDEVEVIRVGFPIGAVLSGPGAKGISRSRRHDFDYEIRLKSGQHTACLESALRKRPPKGLPESITRIFEIKEIA